MTSNAPLLAVVHHKGAGRAWYTLARLVELDGQQFALSLPQGQYPWQERQFGSKAKAFAAARAAGRVHPDIVVQDFTQRHCFAVKPLA